MQKLIRKFFSNLLVDPKKNAIFTIDFESDEI